MSPALITSLVAVVVGPLGAYLVVVRRASGKISNSEAGQLWEESKSIRDWATARISELNSIVERLERKVADLETRNGKLHLENGQLTRILDEHTATIAELREQIHRLSDDNQRLRQENIALRVRVEELEGGSHGTA